MFPCLMLAQYAKVWKLLSKFYNAINIYQVEKQIGYLKAQAMMKISPGARFGMAVAIAGEVRLIPFRNRDWNKVTLWNKHKKKKNYIVSLTPMLVWVFIIINKNALLHNSKLILTVRIWQVSYITEPIRFSLEGN